MVFLPYADSGPVLVSFSRSQRENAGFQNPEDKINYILNFTTKDFYGLFCLLQFFLNRARLVRNKISAHFYIWKTVLRQRSQIGNRAGYAQIILLTVCFIFGKFFCPAMNCSNIFQFQKYIGYEAARRTYLLTPPSIGSIRSRPAFRGW